MRIWEATGERFVLDLREVSGALGDLGTLLPLTLGILAVGGHAPTPVLLGFAAFYVATALVYRLPIPVQPMKAVAAVILTAGIPVAGVAASGLMIGAVLLLLGATGWIDRVARSVPRSVLAGLQLGLGLALGLFAVRLIGHAPATGLAILGLLIGLRFAPRLPAAIIALAAAILLGWAIGDPGLGFVGDPVEGFALPAWPGAAELATSFTVLTLPQLSLTLSNAVLLTALLAGDYFGTRAEHVTPARLSVTSGLANLLLVPFGALPMCHGAGGLAAHYRFGARSGTAPLLLGLALAALALAPGRIAVDLLSAVPVAGLGALLLVAAAELALSRRLFDGRPSCLPVIATTAGVTLWVDPFWGLLAGCGAELLRVAVLRRSRPGGASRQPE